MADRYDDLVRRVEALERELRESRVQKQRQVFGTQDVPLQRVYIRDGQTGSVAQADYDAAAGTWRLTKVR